MLFNALGLPITNQLSFQTAATPFMEGIIDLHHNLFFFMILIFVFVFWTIINCIFYFVTSEKLVLFYNKHFYKNAFSGIVSNNSYYSLESPLLSDVLIKNFNISNKILKSIISSLFNFDSDIASWAKIKNRSLSLRFNHGTVIEFVWTVAPCVILSIIAIQSFNLLYSAEDVTNAYISIKVIGHQWFWTYEYTYAYDAISANIAAAGIELENGLLYAYNFNYMTCYEPETNLQLEVCRSNDDKYVELHFNDFTKSFVYPDCLCENDVMPYAYDNDFTMLLHDILMLGDDERDCKECSLAEETRSELIDCLIDHIYLQAAQEEAAPTDYILKHVNITSYMVPTDELSVGDLRLLECDKVLYVPAHVHINFYITAVDVIHSWAIPSLGIKMDAIPGRLNMVSTYVARTGVYYGQCSEICGINHGFMPIVLIAYEQ